MSDLLKNISFPADDTTFSTHHGPSGSIDVEAMCDITRPKAGSEANDPGMEFGLNEYSAEDVPDGASFSNTDLDIFRLFDLDGGGSVDKQEFRTRIQQLRPDEPDERNILQFIGQHCHRQQLSAKFTKYYIKKAMQSLVSPVTMKST